MSMLLQLILSEASLLMWFWVIIVTTAADKESWKYLNYLLECPQSSCPEISDKHTCPHAHSTYQQPHMSSHGEKINKNEPLTWRGSGIWHSCFSSRTWSAHTVHRSYRSLSKESLFVFYELNSHAIPHSCRQEEESWHAFYPIVKRLIRERKGEKS